MSITPKYYKYAFAQSSPLIDPVQDETTSDTAYGSATYKDGFPSQTMIAKGAGGVPPKGRQFNALLNDITLNQLYLQRGNNYKFSDTVVQAGGYARGAILSPDAETDPCIYQSVVTNNKANFNADSGAIGKYWRQANGIPWYFEWKVYPEGFIVTGEDKKTYKALLANGPGMVKGTVTPGTDDTVWKPYGDCGEKMEYLPTPRTGALRNDLGCTQVEDPIRDKDAANKRWVLNEINRGIAGVAQPVITSPVDAYTFQTFVVSVKVTGIQLTGGGSATPAETHIRVLAANQVDIIAEAVTSYTTKPSVAVPNTTIGKNLFVIVRHKDEVEGWSTWSDKKPIKMASVTQYAATIIYPARYAQNISFAETFFTFSPGKWSDGSAYSGSKTQLIIYNVADNSVAYNSGWVGYGMMLTIPSGTLAAGKQYWAAVQHQAQSGPASNPDATLESPKITSPNDENATVFTTMAAQAPDVSGLQHSFPTGMKHGEQASAAIWGATSTDGTTVSYDIRSISYGLSFSKTSGITDNETIIIGASAASQVYTASFQIVAKSAAGGEAAPVPVSIFIVQPITAFYGNPGNYTFACPVSGHYQIIVGGGGGNGWLDGTNSNVPGGGGGGGGCTIHNALYLNGGTVYNITVGDAEKTTSFHGLVYATGGSKSNPGEGYGGQSNTTGGSGGSSLSFGMCYARSGGGGAGYNNGGNGAVQTTGSYGATIVGGASGGGTGGENGKCATIAELGGTAGFAGGGGGFILNEDSTAIGGHGCCHVNFSHF